MAIVKKTQVKIDVGLDEKQYSRGNAVDCA